MKTERNVPAHQNLPVKTERNVRGHQQTGSGPTHVSPHGPALAHQNLPVKTKRNVPGHQQTGSGPTHVSPHGPALPFQHNGLFYFVPLLGPAPPLQHTGANIQGHKGSHHPLRYADRRHSNSCDRRNSKDLSHGQLYAAPNDGLVAAEQSSRRNVRGGRKWVRRKRQQSDGNQNGPEHAVDTAKVAGEGGGSNREHAYNLHMRRPPPTVQATTEVQGDSNSHQGGGNSYDEPNHNQNQNQTEAWVPRESQGSGGDGSGKPLRKGIRRRRRR
ncbi:uncharacterized protein LOC112524738 [Cynara cardunculus var. scolymus]|uniref:uncharacterized protein LOC112524738 n=1 Tax=Cynara cardunculus var. scolymus TaxID=59895 RepID=UPI000D62DE31|nr:uncharacterized protein LOC112524738 [Cynara cardunculus var. scolymus]